MIIKPISPKIPTNPDIVDVSAMSFQDEDSLENCEVSGGAVEEQTAVRLSFRLSRFNRVVFREVVFEQIDLMDVSFVGCNLANADFERAVIHRVAFIECNLMGMNFGSATLRNVVFQNCNLDFSSFRVSDMENVVFEDCRMRRADMQQSRVVLSEFRQCSLKEFQMHGTPARGLDFSTCDIDGLGIRTEELSGATVSPEQAVYLARKIGLIVKD